MYLCSIKISTGLNKLKPNINVVFDVGSRYDSEFVNIDGEVHYFEPVPDFIERLSKQKKQQ